MRRKTDSDRDACRQIFRDYIARCAFPLLPPSHIFQVCSEFTRVASKNLEEDFFEELDQLVLRFLQLYKERKGVVGQKLTEIMQDINCAVSCVI